MSTKIKQIRAALTAASVAVLTMASASTAIAANDAMLEQGKTVFNTVAGVGCAGCHGNYGEGDLGVGPFIRGASEGSIRAAIEGIGAMVAVKTMINEEDIKAVSAYVETLGNTQVVRTMAKRGRFLPAEFSVYPGTSVQLVIQNASTKGRTFASQDLGDVTLAVKGRKSSYLHWNAPQEEGVYTLTCTDCKLKGEVFTLTVSKDAPQFKPVKPVSTDTLDSSTM